MMTRTQVSFESRSYARARKRAAELGLSFAAYLRRLVERDLGRPDAVSEPSVIFGIGDSGGSDVARDKDRMVADAVEARWRRSRGEDA